jgi:hypothetical protein
MAKFNIYGIWTASKFIGEFEAETEEEAVEMAANSEENHVCLCHQCANQVELDEYSAQEFQVEKVD